MSTITAALPRLRTRVRGSSVFAYPELLCLLGASAVLNLWNLSVNGWANTYYSAAVRSMSTSWHDFLFASLDRSGLMTVDKPPLALWIQALSARIFGFHPLSLLIPEALMGVAAVGLLYDLVRRPFGRLAGLLAGAALALTPIAVAIARFNNPDELLILLMVAALWCALRALDTGRVRWLVICGICVGLGFETKMLLAFVVVPGIAVAWLLLAPHGRLRAIRELLGAGAAMLLVAGAWPLLVMLTPAADRPWISGTADNSIWSLIFGYNGVGRVAGQAGGPQALGGGGGTFGGSTGVFRLLNSSLGDQAGWLLGFAVVAGLGLLIVTRLRRDDRRTGWLLIVGGAFATTAVIFSFARGIFHPYYVSLLAPFAAALVGAGAGLVLEGGRGGRLIVPIAIAAGVVTELVVLRQLNGSLSWATPLVIAVGGGCAVLLAWTGSRRAGAIVVSVALAALLAAPAVWAARTLGHAENSTFPAGGPASTAAMGPGAGGHGFAGRGGFGAPGGRGFAHRPGGGGPGARGFARGGGAAGARGFAPGGRAAGQTLGGGGIFGGDTGSLNAAIRYADAHGGGTIGVESQSSAASVILSSDANVAGLGGFSGRESSVTADWIAMEVRDGRLRWILIDDGGSFQLPGDTRAGSERAFDVVAKACRGVTIDGGVKLYDCQGRAAAIVRDA